VIRTLERGVEKIAERRRGEERLRSGPAGNVEGTRRMSAGGGGVGGMMRAKDMLDEAAVHALIRLHAVLGIDEKALAAYGAADARGEFRWRT
jgi:hypothetical protein